ncbi:MAG: hypothetical protein ACREMV_09190 [Gemmatimonadales bacterium]
MPNLPAVRAGVKITSGHARRAVEDVHGNALRRQGFDDHHAPNVGYSVAGTDRSALCAGRRLGDELANELVEWFNQVDATYRLEFRDLFDANFGRLDAKLEQRISELRTELRSEMEVRFAQADAKLDQRTAELRTEIQTGLSRLEGGLVARIGMAEGRLARLTMLGWAGFVAAWVALAKF